MVPEHRGTSRAASASSHSTPSSTRVADNKQGEIRGREDCARWLSDVLDGLGVERAPFVGLSQGGWLAASAARFIPNRVMRIALLAPGRNTSTYAIACAPGVAPASLPSEEGATGGDAQPDERYLAQVALGAQHFRYQQPPVFPTVFPDEDLRRMSASTLLLVADHEVVYRPRSAVRRARRLIPNLEAEVVPEAGHFMSMEQAEIVDRRILAFLGEPTHVAEPAWSSHARGTTSERGNA